MGQPLCLEKIKPNSIPSTTATPQDCQRHTHRDQDLEGAVHDLDVPILQGTAYHRDVGMAIQPFDPRHWSLLPYTARTVFTPPWLVPGDVECQEFAVLKRIVAKRSPFTIRTSDMLSDGGHTKINGKPEISKDPHPQEMIAQIKIHWLYVPRKRFTGTLLWWEPFLRQSCNTLTKLFHHHVAHFGTTTEQLLNQKDSL